MTGSVELKKFLIMVLTNKLYVVEFLKFSVYHNIA